MWSPEKKEVLKVTNPIETDLFVNVAYKKFKTEGIILIPLFINSNYISVYWKYKHLELRQIKP